MRRLLFVLCLVSTAASAEITRIEIASETPFAGGKSFGAVGPYVRFTGRFYGDLDPSSPSNRNIVDIQKAPRNARGRVEYSADFDLLRPADLAKGNGTLFYDVNNRGNKRLIHLLNDVPANNALETPESAGDGFLMRHGFAVAWSGWIPAGRAFPAAPHLLRLEVPDAQGIEQPVWDEFLFNDGKQLEGKLSFTPASLSRAQARLTVRERNDAAPTAVPRWEYVGDGAIRLLPEGTPFRAGALYQFAYRAKNPPVSGIGYAATRDWVAFLRYAARDKAGTPNPMAAGGHKVVAALAHGTSQSGRFLRDMVYSGFNETEDLRIVFDGINPHNAPAGGFPFAYAKLRDPLTLREDGLLERCRARTTCPKIVHTVSSTEYWQGGHSLNTTDVRGEGDLALPDNVRIYHFAGTQHVMSATMPKGACAVPDKGATNLMVDPRPGLRALVLALDRWAKGGAPPPASVYPKIADGTLVPAAQQKWPAIPGLTLPRSPNPMPQFDYGKQIAAGIIDNVPPALKDIRYTVLVPQVDADGNEVAGLRMPEQAVPAYTTTGWSLRSAEAGGAGELCYLDGMALPFAKTAEERGQDPRLSLAERYGDRAAFISKIRNEAKELQKRGFYLEEDIEKTVARATAAW